ncbi:MAG: class I SAM-dependent methyltransferase [Bacteroidia bacterium]
MKSHYYKTKETVDEYIKLSKGIDSLKLIEKLKQFLPDKSKLLEIGSGPGSDWRILSQNFITTGSDYSNEFIKRLNIKFPDGQFLMMDAVTLESEESFDGIYSNKVLHHLNNDELLKSIERQCDILDSKGIICHSFWKGEGSEFFKGLYVKYHSKSSLTDYFGVNFDILLLEEYQEFEPNDSLVLIARKK